MHINTYIFVYKYIYKYIYVYTLLHVRTKWIQVIMLANFRCHSVARGEHVFNPLNILKDQIAIL